MNDYKVQEFVEKAKRLIENGQEFQFYMSNEGEFVIDTTQANNVEIDLDELNLDEMSADQLIVLKDQLKKWYDLLENEEPDDSDTEQYEQWEEQLDEIDNVISDIENLLSDGE